jgi:hypothetical protein
MTGEPGDRGPRGRHGESDPPPEERAAFPSTPGEPGADGTRPHWEADPGAYIGHEPELAADRLPEPLGPDDERVAAHSTQGTGVGRPDERGQPGDQPSGHALGDRVSDDDVREAGQDR